MAQRDELFEWMSTNNLNWLVQFHNHVNALLVRAKSDASHQPDKNIAIFWEHIYENQFPNSLRTSVFLMIFGHVEEMLLLLSQTNRIDLAGKGFDKYRPMIKKAFGSDLAHYAPWNYLQDAIRVRNTILHAAGRPSLMEKPERVSDAISRNKTSFSLSNGRIVVSAIGLRQLAKSSESFINELNQRLSTAPAEK